jgi:hypothetical protein
MTYVPLLGSAVLAFFDIEALLNIFIVVLTLVTNDGKTISALATPLVLLLGLAALVFIIVTMEYHMKYAGEQRSHKLLAISLAVQMVLLLVGFVGLGAVVH